jgi:uncharacterized protein YkwD
MNKCIPVAVLLTTITLFALTSQPETAVSSTAITIDDFQTNLETGQPSFSMPTLRPFPTGNFQSSRIRSSTLLQIVISSSSATPTASPQSTKTPTATPIPSTTPSAVPSSTSPQSNSFSDQVIKLVNVERSKASLSTLTKNNSLTNSAQNYALTMANQNFFSHTGLDGSTFTSRNTAAGYTGYRWMGENIAAGQASPQEVMSGWMASPGHKANILNTRAKEIGVGYATSNSSRYKKYWVQEFGAR